MNAKALQMWHKQFEVADKPRPMLSRQLRGTRVSRAIHDVKTH